MTAETGEAALWQAVIRQALVDATSASINPDHIRKARDWLTNPNSHFAYVCNLAGKDPEKVRRNATRHIAEHDEGMGSSSTLHEWNGESLTVSQWAKKTGIQRTALHHRLKAGWPIERALTELKAKPVRSDAVYLEHNGQRQTLTEWARQTGISHGTLYARIMKGWTAEQVITTPLSARRGRTNSDQTVTPPGEGLDFAGEALTGGGSTAHDFAQTDFPQEDSTL